MNKCQSEIWNLIHCLESESMGLVPGPAMVRMTMETANCDGGTSLQAMRTHVSESICRVSGREDAMKSISSYERDEKLDKICDETMWHIGFHARNRWLYDALQPLDKAYFISFYKLDRWKAKFGLDSPVSCTQKLAKNLFQKP
ncbi:Hypothetical Protein FCC1311_058192 [Hondaea fermentalgiana]|uniref:Uncharacterized protein n=1 Tax=Hondaea fermentalgiana TaxID=2315210 RepID=A0A2R5GIP3_9STRA|nr:Hypothetical Protein FCC1311_058192 [Hondaea fermentalgiana]|eukprot:GBG29598.1 Hypothetical Protein FCC1311_058192 [Hondaea fermentalgiana]